MTARDDESADLGPVAPACFRARRGRFRPFQGHSQAPARMRPLPRIPLFHMRRHSQTHLFTRYLKGGSPWQVVAAPSATLFLNKFNILSIDYTEVAVVAVFQIVPLRSACAHI